VLAALAPLALPGLGDPFKVSVRRRSHDVARGVVRAMLRRDHPTAARLARWLALAEHHGGAAVLDLLAVLDHLDLEATEARTALDTAIARRLSSTGWEAAP
jgi:hypothetical protein